MTNRILSTALIALVFVGAGCAAATTPSAAPAAPDAAAFVPQSPCDNPYYPLSLGYEIGYATQSGGKTVNYQMVVSSVTDESAQVDYRFSEPTPFVVSQELGCAAGTLMARTYLDMASALGNVDMKAETKAVNGELMPASLAVGQSWTNSFETTLKPGPNFPAQMGAMSAVVDAVNTVVSQETVTVPAGTFASLKVEQKMTQTVSVPGMPAMAPQVMTSYQWWVKGVGLVKQTSGAGETGEGVTEAVTIKRP